MFRWGKLDGDLRVAFELPGAWQKLVRLDLREVLAWLVLLISLEWFGRHVSVDYVDLFGVGAMGAMALATLRRRGGGAPGLARGLLQMRRWLSAGRYEFGLDLRETPPLPRRWPRAATVLCSSAGLVLVALLVIGDRLPTGLRAVADHGLYILYLPLLGAIWGASLLTIAFMLFVSFASLRDVGHRCFSVSHRKRATLLLVAGYVLLLTVSARSLPAGSLAIAVPVCIATLLGVLILPHAPRLNILWRRAKGLPSSFDWRRLLATEAWVIGACVLSLCLLGQGTAPSEKAWRIMPITTGLGWCLNWAGVSGICVVTLHHVSLLLSLRMQNPGKPVAPRIRIGGGLTSGLRRRVRRVLRQDGWRVRFDESPTVLARGGPDEIVISIDPGASVEDAAFASLSEPIASETLFHSELRWRLRRREMIRRRRVLMRGTEKLFKRAAGYRFDRAGGFWFAPHLWFFGGLRRDSGEGLADRSLRPIGLPFRQVFDPAARQHFFDVMRGVDIDLIFVEDGVGFRRLRSVLRVIFEVWDMHGGNRSVREWDFRGLVGVRVIIHDLQPDAPFRSAVYQEPGEQKFGRARVLHVFRERSRGSEISEIPFGLDRVPEPTLTL
ncbi:MAG: hypothetical protein QF412_15900 [Planctomycetota bacterium]|nr:hypothetical protein [Planctomycetota bacterium]